MKELGFAELVFIGEEVNVMKKNTISVEQCTNNDTGEIMILETVARHIGEVVGVFEAKPKDPKDMLAAKRQQKYVKVRTAREQKRLYRSMTSEQKAFLFSLLPYMDWETNILIGDGEDGENGKPLRWCHVQKIAGISKPTRIKLMRVLEEKGVIGYMLIKRAKKGIVVNPRYALNGRVPQESLLAVFDSEKDVEDE